MRLSADQPRLGVALTLAACLGLLALLWLSGALGAIGIWAIEQQRGLQTLLAQHIQAVRSGQSPAFWALLALSAGYGFVHAVGPGHGKILVTGAAIGTRASAGRMAAIALAGSLGQAAIAILLVYGGFAFFAATARGAIGLETALEPIGHLAVVLVGIWLLVRGLRGLAHQRHGGVEGAACACGHRHGPDPAAVARVASLREAAALVAAMAARPCAGALIVLVLAWRMDVPGTGAAAVVAMGLGTAAFTVGAAILAVFGREAALFSVGRASGRARRLAPMLQIAAGSSIALISGGLLLTVLGQ